ncbi:MAG: hypothetical protein IJT36_03560 [Alphaproteobacteria bacterium]|nr:hypothetical protein [Alphaproteobacteria bacterium]
MTRDVYLIEFGILLDKNSKEAKGYTTVYDKEYGYFDEDQFYSTKESYEEKKAEYLDYVKEGVENTYIVVSETAIDDNDEDELPQVSEENYLCSNVVFSAAKINGKIVENFIKQEVSKNG